MAASFFRFTTILECVVGFGLERSLQLSYYGPRCMIGNCLACTQAPPCMHAPIHTNIHVSTQTQENMLNSVRAIF